MSEGDNVRVWDRSGGGRDWVRDEGRIGSDVGGAGRAGGGNT